MDLQELHFFSLHEEERLNKAERCIFETIHPQKYTTGDKMHFNLVVEIFTLLNGILMAI